jgi:hypothetical protein
MKYAIERADGHIFAIESDLQPDELLKKMRELYEERNSFSTFTPHINSIPICVYIVHTEIK